MKIKQIKARQILDSRGWPTVECSLVFESGQRFLASAPSGQSESDYCAVSIRDADPNKYFGEGVTKAIDAIENRIAKVLIGKVPDISQMDQIMIELDGTPNKSNLGVNAILPVSVAILKAQAHLNQIPLYKCISQISGTLQSRLPKAMFNVINGGMHTDNNLLFQEFMIMPQQKSFAQNLMSAATIYHHLKNLCKQRGYGTGVGDEGGFAPLFKTRGSKTIQITIDLLIESIQKAGYLPGKDVMICLDVAASTFYDKEHKEYVVYDKKISAKDLINLYDTLVTDYPIYSIEDGLSQDDWEGWQLMYSRLGDRIQLVGDDIFATNCARIGRALDLSIANASVVKPNQIGTISESLAYLTLCKKAGYKTIISHRSGETNDSFIAELAVGVDAGQFKAGAPARGERIAKYNRLLEIEEELLKSPIS